MAAQTAPDTSAPLDSPDVLDRFGWVWPVPAKWGFPGVGTGPGLVGHHLRDSPPNPAPPGPTFPSSQSNRQRPQDWALGTPCPTVGPLSALGTQPGARAPPGRHAPQSQSRQQRAPENSSKGGALARWSGVYEVPSSAVCMPTDHSAPALTSSQLTVSRIPISPIHSSRASPCPFSHRILS